LRAKNVLRWWLQTQGFERPSRVKTDEMLKQLLQTGQDKNVRIALGGGIFLHRYAGQAVVVAAQACANVPFNVVWQGEAELPLPNKMRLVFTQQLGQGISLHKIKAMNGHLLLNIKSRVGGERLKPDVKRPARALKTLLQAAHIPPWQRESLPLVWQGETLICVPNIAVAADWQAIPHEMGIVIQFIPAD
jgi:tRNA(Ile)-lysidine synthase